MPPKKKTTSHEHASKPAPTSASQRKQQSKPASKQPSTKRKSPPTSSAPATKRTTRRTEAAALKSPADTTKTLNFLLSTDARAYTVNTDELNAAKSQRTYTSVIPLSPFEELLCAVVLSRPISHRLGQRAIRTLLNPGYSFSTPKAILDAGVEKVHEALEKARTQHKGKTTEQIGLLAETAKDEFGSGARDTALGRLRSEADGDADALREKIKGSVKGAGVTAVNIFLRRIQSVWDEFYPNIDERTSNSVEKLGLPTDADELRKLVDSKWSSLKTDHIEGDGEEAKKRTAYVLILERATGADLEGRLNEVIEQSSKS